MRWFSTSKPASEVPVFKQTIEVDVGLPKIFKPLVSLRLGAAQPTPANKQMAKAVQTGKGLMLIMQSGPNVVRRAGFKDLSWIKFNQIAAGFLGLGDGIKGGEFFKVVSLRLNKPTILTIVI
jgi:hypothetical protein